MNATTDIARTLRNPLVWAAMIAAMTAAGGALADVSATDRVLARSLYEQGRELMTAGNYKEACPKFAESQRLDPAGGTLLNLAACHEKEGRTASAWSEFNDALAQARRDDRSDRQQVAQERINALTPILSRITIKLAAGAEVEGLVIKLDNVAVGRAVLGAAIPIDPGSHQIEASAPGKKPWSTKVDIGAQKDNKAVEIPPLEAGPAAPAGAVPTAPPTGSVAPPPDATSAPPDTQDSGSSKRMAGYIVGGAGVVALGIGSYFGLRAFSKWDDSKSHCPNGACDAEAVSLKDDANSAAWVSNIGLGLGLAGVGVGAYLILTSGSSKEAQQPASAQVRLLPLVGSKSGGLGLQGTW